MPCCNNPPSVIIGGATHTRVGGGSLITPSSARPHARTYRAASLHKHKKCSLPLRQSHPAPTYPSSLTLRNGLVCYKRTPRGTSQQSRTSTGTIRARPSLTAPRLTSSPRTLFNTTPRVTCKALWRSKIAWLAYFDSSALALPSPFSDNKR